MVHLLWDNTAGRNQTARVAVWLVIVGLLLLLTFQQILLRTAKSWAGFDGSYGLLIFVISVYMIWDRRELLARAIPSPEILPGLTVVVAGASLQLVATLSYTMMLQGIALVITLLGLVWLILGRSFLRLLAIPIGYLAFMFHFFEELLGLISGTLQTVTSHLAGTMLKTLGIPVFLSGDLIQMPHITLEVAKVCNGVNHIIALVALAVPIAVIIFPLVYQKVALVALAFFIGLFANALRVTLIGLWTIKYKEESIHGPFEILYVSFIVAVGLVLIGAVVLVSKKMGWTRPPQACPGGKNRSGLKHLPEKMKTAPMIWAAVVFTALLAHKTLWAGHRVELETSLDRFPEIIGKWQGRDINDLNWPFRNLVGDQILRRIYTRNDGSFPIGLTVSYFERQRQDKEVINQSLMWLHLRSTTMPVYPGEGSIWINRGEARGIEAHSYKDDPRTFYFFYYANGKVLTDPYIVKWESMISELIKGTSEAAIVVFSTEKGRLHTSSEMEKFVAFMNDALPEVIRFIGSGRKYLSAEMHRSARFDQ